MATFAPVIRYKKSDGLYAVYIRVSQGQGKLAYIKTCFSVGEKGLKRTYSKSGKEAINISDPIVLGECIKMISVYAKKLNTIDSLKMSVQEIVIFLTTGNHDLSFSQFSKEYIIKMSKEGRDNSAGNYILAVKRLREFLQKDDILFKDLTISNLLSWIDSMKDSSRKRNLYPTCIKTMINTAMLQYNDEERDIIRIRFNPFSKIKIPKNKIADKRSVEIDVIKTFFNTEVRVEFQGRQTKEKTAQDVCKMVFCLAGINTADLYDLKPTALVDGYLKYKRKKTRDKSDYEAYTEIKIPEILIPLFEKYKGEERLLCFYEQYSSADIFADIVSRGCRSICKSANLEKITPYSFRHSWATIAINDCAGSLDDVALSLNHASGHKITSTYVRCDYTRIDKLNELIIAKVF
jgi:integrase